MHNYDHIVLDNGDWLVKHYEKYQSGLTILHKPDFNPFNFTGQQVDNESFNLHHEGSFRIINGEFFVSKKGTKCFRAYPDGDDQLVCHSWGGAFNTSRPYGKDTFGEDAKYYRNASSNGGGQGNEWVVLPRGWTKTVSEDDI